MMMKFAVGTDKLFKDLAKHLRHLRRRGQVYLPPRHIADFNCFNRATQPVESVLGDGIKVEIDAIARARG